MNRQTSHPTPPPDKQRIVRTAKPRESEIDRQVEASFPASDPPSYSGGSHAVGAPDGRKSTGDGK